ncbi:MAG: hypothetical protein HFI91_13265 [Lachnospiraceae bacterium]|nr:hypothetical protein [Lachnospiraceae bacterium]
MEATWENRKSWAGFRMSEGMPYFAVGVDNRYIPPSPLGCQEIINRKMVTLKKPHEFPRNLLFMVEPNTQMTFTDVVNFPCFMVSSMVREAVLRYEPFMRFVRVILYDRERKENRAYHIPFMERQKAVEGRGTPGAASVRLRVDRQSLEDRALVEITCPTGQAVIMRMDLTESILRRGALGISLGEVETVQRDGRQGG